MSIIAGMLVMFHRVHKSFLSCGRITQLKMPAGYKNVMSHRPFFCKYLCHKLIAYSTAFMISLLLVHVHSLTQCLICASIGHSYIHPLQSV